MAFSSSSSLCLLLFRILLVAVSAASDARTDKLSLLAFKDALIDGDSMLGAWNASTSTCQWPGITCSSDSRIVGVSLSSMGLSGPISPEIGNLTTLATLNLSKNSITGSIPSSLGNLLSLTSLDLSGNNLTGTIPSSIVNATSLASLVLSSNMLEGPLPKNIGRLRNLTELRVGLNMLSGDIPASLFNITSLQIVNLVKNSFSGSLPPDMGITLPNISFLNVNGNNLRGPIPSSLTSASNLKLVDLGSNQFTGPIPADFGKLKSLYWLSLSYNSLEISSWDFLVSVMSCTQLTFFSVAGNNLQGELPTTIPVIPPNLTRLNFGETQIIGSIPSWIGNFTKLNTLLFQRNNLSGPIPEFLMKLTNLGSLVLFSNKFSGQIPQSIGNLVQITELYLNDNQLTGEIPSTMGQCQALNILDMSSNKLTGHIIDEVLTLPALSNYLNLSNNLLSGELSPLVGKLKNLQTMDFSRNRLSGELPSTIGDCEMLSVLYLQENRFRGVVPSSLRRLISLTELDLSHNNFSGPVPSFLQDSKYLQKLDLSYNDFSGEVPTTGLFMNASAVMVKGNNLLCGGSAALNLPPCENRVEKNHRSHLLRILLPILFGTFFIALIVTFITFFWKRKYRRNISGATTPPIMHSNLSYAELAKATGNFSSQNLIGSGTYGSVYKGTMMDGRIVAVKVLHLAVRGAHKSFLAECAVLRNTRHRNLLKIITVCASVDSSGKEFKALVFEFMSNKSLEDWLHRRANLNGSSRRLGLARRLDIAIDVAHGLSYLHSEFDTPIVHCDLKPSNVLLDSDMTARVADFGLAKFLTVNGLNVYNGQSSSSLPVQGSIGYIAPEYGMGRHVSTEGDVYSFGILLLELFTGKRPTDDSFTEGHTLPTFVKGAMQKGTPVIDIADPALFPDPAEKRMDDFSTGGNIQTKDAAKCLISVFNLALLCANDQPFERITMKDAANGLVYIKEQLLSKFS